MVELYWSESDITLNGYTDSQLCVYNVNEQTISSDKGQREYYFHFRFRFNVISPLHVTRPSQSKYQHNANGDGLFGTLNGCITHYYVHRTVHHHRYNDEL